MKRGSTVFLQGVIAALGISTLTLLLWEPHLEGVNAEATTLSQIYFDDPFLVLVYAGSIPFFMALYQAFQLLGHIRRHELFSQPSVRALRTIKYCALAIIGFVITEEIFIILNHGDDDTAGGIVMGIFITFGSMVIATAAAVFERALQSAADIKSENDLTV